MAVISVGLAGADTRAGTSPAPLQARQGEPSAIPGNAVAIPAPAVHVAGCGLRPATGHTARRPGKRPRSDGNPGSGPGGHHPPDWGVRHPAPMPWTGRFGRAGTRSPAGRTRRSGKPAGTGRIARTGRRGPPPVPAGWAAGREQWHGRGTWPAMLAPAFVPSGLDLRCHGQPAIIPPLSPSDHNARQNSVGRHWRNQPDQVPRTEFP